MPKVPHHAAPGGNEDYSLLCLAVIVAGSLRPLTSRFGRARSRVDLPRLTRELRS
jgi:hypothetical protein